MKVPVTVITGYLGAGKTTLLRRIADWAGSRGMRLAVVMNEFGEIAIDSKVVAGKNIAMAELAGGCVCCSFSGEFSLAVAELIEKANPEWIVVETTGVAEPAALAYDIKDGIPGIRLDAIVTVVDADAMARFPSLGQTGREQIELADMLIMNKRDLIGAQACESVLLAVRELNKKAEILEAERCAVDMGALFGRMGGKESKPHMGNEHAPEFESFTFITDRTLDHASFISALERLPPRIYRAKGFAITSEGRFLVNFVAGRHELEPHECKKTELVFIGKDAESCRDEVAGALGRIAI